jgi:mannose-6-phosphate isomerase-like protein (cupin superfamily)
VSGTNDSSGGLRWFFANLADVKLTKQASGGQMAIVHLTAPPGDMPPLHVHRTDDEAWAVLEGEMSFYVGSNEPVRVGPGGVAFGPKGVPHTFRVESEEPARVLVICTPGDFDGFVVAASRPAERAELPPEPDGPPTEEQAAAIGELAAKHGIDLLGPPGTLPGDAPAD